MSSREPHRPGRAPADWAARIVLALVVALVYRPPVAASGLRTDVGAHLVDAEGLALTGRIFSPYYLWEQSVVLVRALIPFGLLAKVDPGLAARQSTWDIAGVATMVLFAIASAEVVYGRIRGAARRAREAVAVPVSLVVSLGLVLASPVTIFTWTGHHLLLGYITPNSFESPTTTALKPAALALFVVLADRIGTRVSRRSFAAVLGLSLLALHAKPSYTLCLLPVVGAYVLWGRLRRSSFEWRLPLLGFVVPSVAVLALQSLTFASVGGIEVAPLKIVSRLLEARGQPTWVFLPLLVASVAFPIAVVAAIVGSGRGEPRVDRPLGLAWATFGAGAATFYLLAITGRTDYGDLIGGAQVAGFVLFVESARVLVRAATAPAGGSTPTRARVLAVAAWAIFGLHVACGLFLAYRETVDPAAWW